MDIRVTVGANGYSWHLTDLLGRDLGCIVEASAGTFEIHPAGKALETMAALTRKSYRSVDEVLTDIEVTTRGVCRRVESPAPRQ